MTQTLPSWLPAVIAGGLYAAVGFAVVGVASAAVDWHDRRKAHRAPDADRTTAPRRTLGAPLSHETGSRVPVAPGPAERRSQPPIRKEAR